MNDANDGLDMHMNIMDCWFNGVSIYFNIISHRRVLCSVLIREEKTFHHNHHRRRQPSSNGEREKVHQNVSNVGCKPFSSHLFMKLLYLVSHHLSRVNLGRHPNFNLQYRIVPHVQ